MSLEMAIHGSSRARITMMVSIINKSMYVYVICYNFLINFEWRPTNDSRYWKFSYSVCGLESLTSDISVLKFFANILVIFKFQIVLWPHLSWNYFSVLPWKSLCQTLFFFFLNLVRCYYFRCQLWSFNLILMCLSSLVYALRNSYGMTYALRYWTILFLHIVLEKIAFTFLCYRRYQLCAS